MEDQIWLKIKSHQNYSISNHGKVRNDKSGRILKPRYSDKGYARAALPGKSYGVHRLVAEHFVDNPKPEEYNQVNHIDGVKSNNHYSNLEWCSAKMNVQHAFKNGLNSAVGEKNSHCKISDEEILRIWSSDMATTEISKKYSITIEYASRIKNRRIRTYLLGNK